MEKHEDDLVLNLNAYGVGAVTFDQNVPEHRDRASFIERVLCNKLDAQFPLGFDALADGIDIFRHQPENFSSGFFYFYIVNNQDVHTFNDESEFTKFQGLRLLDNHQGRDDCEIRERGYKLKVAPGQRKIIIMDVVGTSISYGISQQASFSS